MLQSQPEFRRLFLRTIAVVAGLAGLTNLIVVLQDHRVTLLSGVVLLLAAAYLMWVVTRNTPLLSRTRFGAYALHATAFVVVVGGFWVHAAYLALVDSGGVDQAWLGPLSGMTIGWGLGLVIHTIGALKHKGFDDVRI